MTLEELRTYFATARDFVKLGNSANVPIVLASIEAISNHIKGLYETASAFDKAKCRVQFESFDFVAEVLKTKGIGDKRVLAFFGVIPSTVDAPSYSEIVRRSVSEAASQSPVVQPPVAQPPKSEAPRSGAAQGTESGSKARESDNANGQSSPDINTQKPGSESAPISPTDPADDAFPSGADADANGGGENAAIFTPDSLRGFIGQQHIVKPLLREIAIAKNKGEKHLANILLFGNPGLGKTTLMQLIAKELGVKFEMLDCSQFRNSQQSIKAMQGFFLRVAQADEPVVIALDEIHALNPELQSSLLTLLESRIYVSPPDATGRVCRIPIKDFTFIGATTDDDKLLETIKNRCLRLTYQMVDYTPDELKRIYKNKIAARGYTISDDALNECVPRSRGAIRYVNSIVDGLDRALYNDAGEKISTHVDLNTALAYFKEKGIHPLGLTDKDLEILQALNESCGDTLGADVLAARVGLTPAKYTSEYEKYLIKIGFVTVSGRGRSLTESALRYLADMREKGVLKPVGGQGAAPVTTAVPETPSESKDPTPVVATEAPVAPVSPVVPIIPIVPIAPVAPVAPVAPAAPEAPVAPIAPAAPEVPVAPSAPIVPAAPEAPIQSANDPAANAVESKDDSADDSISGSGAPKDIVDDLFGGQ